MAFRVGQKVVYPNHGVSLIEKIEGASFDGVDQMFYHLRLFSNESKVMIPKENLHLVALRPLNAQSDINSLLRVLRNDTFQTSKDCKGRYKQNPAKMKPG